MIQENSFPKDQTRRSVIINLLNIPASLIGTGMLGELSNTKEQGFFLQGEKEKACLISATRDIGIVKQYEKDLDETLKAALFIAESHAQAYLRFLNGETKTIHSAFHLMDEAYKLITVSGNEEHVVQYLHINEERWNLTRASTLIDVHHPKDAMEYLDKLWNQPPSGKRRYAYLNALSARAYLQQGMFPMAVTYALEALRFATETHSTINMTRVGLVYHDLLQTKFSNDPDVIELGLLLMQAQHPHLLLKGRAK